MIYISACLVGEKVRYDGENKLNSNLKKLVDHGIAKPICPEILGGLSTPRNPAEIVGGDGFDVLEKKAKVIDIQGDDVTREYIKGAMKALDICQKMKCKTLILKSDSPTCSSENIYTGEFNGKKKQGVGVFSALLIKHGIQVYNEKNYNI
ncbi:MULTISPECIES: DUF523 domain-containing protein [Staphylococcus]|uniref:DUF523 domain-containing protein n=1 Tax=Staphylococcus TaxID=1279 RepID=UPI00208E4349|nr:MULTISPECIES: DUF523 domain-containing protein [Staphylococcus]MCO4332431.1 DUF523 domain-containing protein [Staphylococcus hyicus]MCO4334665.1 DUF523 domain-containing protein [Staphylococcus hyicus]MCO4358225.1 DUF523 domain-containing protein [Staphylococcus agnetis]MCO4363076.1 DUF523 domain-containing protein [Staphylococcus agnetis]